MTPDAEIDLPRLSICLKRPSLALFRLNHHQTTVPAVLDSPDPIQESNARNAVPDDADSRLDLGVADLSEKRHNAPPSRSPIPTSLFPFPLPLLSINVRPPPPFAQPGRWPGQEAQEPPWTQASAAALQRHLCCSLSGCRSVRPVLALPPPPPPPLLTTMQEEKRGQGPSWPCSARVEAHADALEILFALSKLPRRSPPLPRPLPLTTSTRRRQLST